MMELSRRSLLRSAAAAALGFAGGDNIAAAGAANEVLDVYKLLHCGCCEGWAAHMRSAGFAVRITELEDLGPVKSRFGVSDDLAACHTAVIDGYVVEGHVPAREVLRLLRERPAATGLAVPGMPIGSPGMEMSGESEPYEVILFAPSGRSVFERYP